jgi:hypothetical protein
MGNSKRNRAILKFRKESLRDAVKEELGADHLVVLDYLFDEIKYCMKKMNKVYIPKLGALGVTRQLATKMCVNGTMREEHMKVCEKVASL